VQTNVNRAEIGVQALVIYMYRIVTMTPARQPVVRSAIVAIYTRWRVAEPLDVILAHIDVVINKNCI